MIGVDMPRPGSFTFQAMFSDGLHRTGNPVSRETPLASGPRHWGQFWGKAPRGENNRRRASALRNALKPTRFIGHLEIGHGATEARRMKENKRAFLSIPQ